VRSRPGPPSPLLRAMWADGVYNDANWNEDGFKRTADLEAANRIMPELRADKVAIAPFMKRGGKAIIWQGWADPSTNAGPTIDYYAALARKHGGTAKLGQSVRLFMAPGVYHCRGGPGADQVGGSGHRSWPDDPSRDMLWSLIAWVEQGRAPERLIATRMSDGKEAFTRTLCPYPQAARWDGKGPQDRASSYSCAIDPALVKYLGRKSLVGS